MSALTDLLRSPSRVAERCREDRDMRELALVSLGAIVLGAAVFGAAAGSFRGGAQIAIAAAKVPLALVATLAIAAPTFHALAAALGRPWPMRTVVALALAAAGRSALVLLALSPILWLVMGSGLGYHQATLACVFAYAIAGSAALGILVRGLGAGAGRLLTLGAFVAVFFAVGGQTAWSLRPYLGRPKTTDVPFMRTREGSFADAVYRTSRSAVGVYDQTQQEWQREGHRYDLDEPGDFALPTRATETGTATATATAAGTETATATGTETATATAPATAPATATATETGTATATAPAPAPAPAPPPIRAQYPATPGHPANGPEPERGGWSPP